MMRQVLPLLQSHQTFACGNVEPGFVLIPGKVAFFVDENGTNCKLELLLGNLVLRITSRLPICHGFFSEKSSSIGAA